MWASRSSWSKGCGRHCPVVGVLILLVACTTQLTAAGESMRAAIEADWLRQVELWATGLNAASKTQADAAGAVDGIRDGKYAFHTGLEPNPWWQVDLGEARSIARIVVYNRLDYAPGLHNADHLGILTSDDGKQWTVRHENRGEHFGGISGAPPLDVRLPDAVAARFVRLQIRSDQPIFFHLDEVEIYGPDDPQQNIALKRPTDQSSISLWSTNKLVPDVKAALPQYTAQILRQGRLLATDLSRRGVDTQESSEKLQRLEAEIQGNTGEWTEARAREVYFSVRSKCVVWSGLTPCLILRTY